MTATIKEELHIECSPTTAFNLMADVREITRWNGGASRADLLTEEPVGLGSQFVTINRGQRLESTITKFDRPERLEFAVTGKMMDVDGTFAFVDTDGATTLFLEFAPRPKGVMTVLFPLLKPLIRRDLVKQHAKFKDFCETQA